MLLPPLFPAFIRDFGLSYSELGLLVTTFFVVAALGAAVLRALVTVVSALLAIFMHHFCFVAVHNNDSEAGRQ